MGGLADGRRGGRDRHRQASDRGMRVDVLHRYRGQVTALSHAGAELRHEQGIGAEVVEEVAVDRHLALAQDSRQQLSEACFDAGLDYRGHRTVS